jgi:hypothetical protein
MSTPFSLTPGEDAAIATKIGAPVVDADSTLASFDFVGLTHAREDALRCVALRCVAFDLI